MTLDVTGDAQTITAAGTTYECLLVPSAVDADRQNVTLTLTIDDNDKTANLTGNNGVIIAPDNFLGGTTALSTIVKDCKTAQDAGIVFLPAAGYRAVLLTPARPAPKATIGLRLMLTASTRTMFPSITPLSNMAKAAA